MINVTLESLCNESEEIYVHSSKQAAEDWLKNIPNTTDGGCSLLVFYRNNYGKIHALQQNKLSKLNENLRILGARNKVEENFWEEIGDHFRGIKVSRLARLQGDEIVPDEPHGVLIVYEKGKGTIGKYFFEILNELNAELIRKVEISPTNNSNLQINARQLMDRLSGLGIGQYKAKAINCKLLSGRIYFINDGKVYRYTFKKNPDNPNEAALLYAEEKDKLTKKNEAYTEKSIRHHYWSTLKGYSKTIVFGIVLGFVGGGIAFAFLSLAGVPFLAPIGAAMAGFGIVTYTIKRGIEQVDMKNKSTVECGSTVFREVSNVDCLENQDVHKPALDKKAAPPLPLYSGKNHNLDTSSEPPKKHCSLFSFFNRATEKCSKAALVIANANSSNLQLR